MLNVGYIGRNTLEMLQLLQWEAEPAKGDMVYATDGVNMAGSLLQMKLIESQGTKWVEETSREYQTFKLW